MLEKYKVTSEEVNKSHVQNAPNRLTGTAQQNKMIFDKLPELLKDKINGVIVSLTGEGGADELGTTAVPGLSGSKLSEQIASIVTLLNDRYTKAEAEALANQETKNLVANVDVNLSNGVITITKKDGTSKRYDTALEKVPAKFEFVQEDGAYKIKVTNVDGSISKTDVTALMNLYSFADTSDIDFSVSGSGVEKTVTATVKAGSIGIDKLSLSAVSAIEGYVSSAATSAQSAEYAKNEAVTAKNEAVDAKGQAETYKVEAVNAASLAGQSKTEAKESEKLSKSYAIGGTGARPEEATDNAKHYSEVARVEADRAKREADRASSIVGGDFATKVEVANAVQVETDNRTQAVNAETAARTQAIQAEANARNQADNQLQQNIAAESETRQNADNILQQNINNETTARQEADGKLITTSEGVHGLRFHDNKLQRKDNDSWTDIIASGDFASKNELEAERKARAEDFENLLLIMDSNSMEQVATERGVHGLRYHENKLQFRHTSGWVSVSVDEVSENAVKKVVQQKYGSIPNSDLNKLHKTGFYGVNRNISNTPYGKQYGGILVFKGNSEEYDYQDDTVQLFADSTKGELFIRVKSHIPWIPWRRVYDSGNLCCGNNAPTSVLNKDEIYQVYE